MFRIIFVFFILSFRLNNVFSESLIWQYQVGQQRVDFSIPADIFDVDMFDTSVQDIQKLINNNKKVICYIDFGTLETWRKDAKLFDSSDIGNNNGWPGEKFLNINSEAVRNIMLKRIQLAKSKKCWAVEPDNIDTYTDGVTGFEISYQDQLNYNIWISENVHANGMQVALKNDQDQISDLISYYDFAIIEQCLQYNECHLSNPFIKENKMVLDVEYEYGFNLNVCNFAYQNISIILKDLSLNAKPWCSCLLKKCIE